MIQAEQACRFAILIDKNSAAAHNNLGNILKDKGDILGAEACYKEALKINPGLVGVYNNLGAILKDRHSYFEALKLFMFVLNNTGPDSNIYNNIAVLFKDIGLLFEAEQNFRRALELDSCNYDAYTGLLLLSQYSHLFTPQRAFAEHQAYGRMLTKHITARSQHANLPEPERRLRVGFVSADLRRHAVAYFAEPVFVELERSQFEVWVYNNSHIADAVTERLRGCVDSWCEVAGLGDEALIEQIVADQIDILIDLSGHTAGNRLSVFAHKPAPVQITWLGYPATTGVPGMDWRITDRYAEPDGLTEDLNSEKLLRLPEIFCCYQPSDSAPLPLMDLPFYRNGYITLGCFNNFAKITPPVIELWGHILSRLPSAKLLLEITGVQHPDFANNVRQRFVQAGASIDQVQLVPRKPEHQYRLYHQLDLALDPFPCNGGTTSCDSLWMGVPFVTLAGKWFVSRMGVTLLQNVGLKQLITHSKEEYADMVVHLANNPFELKALRDGLRAKMQASALMDSKKFSLQFGIALRAAWQEWCGEKVL